mmetsp:Transcript_113407/g.315742  ORF Transcript_113407/g.315742 Transcript_113407/m.315742 type:complete len:142 (+) Transcript_113407:295-720(+)
MLGIGGLLVGVRPFCGEAGRELEPERWVEPNGEAGRLLERVPAFDGTVAGRLRRREVLPSPRISALALTGPPRKAPMPEPPPRGALLTGTGAEAPRTLFRTLPMLPVPGAGLAEAVLRPVEGVGVPLRWPRLGYRNGDSPR